MEALLLARNVRPLVSVVPENRDPVLEVAPADPRFWERVRAWQARGWGIGMHGHDHVYRTNDAGLMGIRPKSEFAGLSYEEQRLKLTKGLAIFRRECVRVDAWVAPAHSFDRTTLRALRELGLMVVSDGYSPSPHVDRHGVVWIPQQLWSLEAKRWGTWTVCFHVNGWTTADLDAFEIELDRLAALMTGVHELVGLGQRRPRDLRDLLFDVYWRGRAAVRARAGAIRASISQRSEI